jgi:hypothetical protein
MGDMPFLDSFDHYNSAHSIEKWTSGNSIGIGVGRRGTNAALVNGGGIFKTFDAEYPTLYVGGAFKNPQNQPFHLYNIITGVAVGMQTAGDGRLYMIGQDPTAGLFTAFSGSAATPPILGDRFYYLEMKAVIVPSNPTQITVQFRINEDIVLNDSHMCVGQIPQHYGWATLNIQGAGGGTDTTVDDVYVNDTGYFGDINIDVMRPVGPSTSNWLPSPSGNANWFNVKDIVPDDDATTVSTVNTNDLDQYAMSSVPAGLNIVAIQGLASAKKGSAGTAAMKLRYNLAELSGEFFPSEQSYIYARDGKTTLNGLSITSAALNALLFGQIRTQ